MKTITLMLAALVINFCLSAQNFNMQLLSTLQYNNSCANIGGYVDALGNEYALVGVGDKLSIVDVTNAANPIEKFAVPMTDNLWKEVKTWQTYAYVTTETCCDQVVIVNLQYMPDSIQYKTYNGDGAIAGQLTSVHSLHIDDGYLYLHGSNLNNGATIICSLTDPWNPQYMSDVPTTYVHDGYVRNDTLWTCNIYDGKFTAVDVSDKYNPVVLNDQLTPDAFTHNCWLNDAGNVLFTTDEVSNSFVAAYEVSDVNNIKFLDKIQTAPGSNSIAHNTHVLNDFLITAWYTEGVTIVDAARPRNLIEVAKYDTYLQPGSGFAGIWGVYPYLPSGNLVLASMDGYMYVIAPTYVRACYLEGMVTDSVTGVGIADANIEITGAGIIEQSKPTGDYATGTVNAGTYTVKVSKYGYFTKYFSNITLVNGQLTLLDVALVPKLAMALSGTVTNLSNGNPIDSARVTLSDSEYEFIEYTDVNGVYTFNNLYESNYEITANKWLYSDSCLAPQTLTGTNTINFAITPRIWDSFINDNHWTITSPQSPGQWVRATPVATYQNNNIANPANDVSDDCGTKCFVTGNDGLNDNVANGTILNTPQLDLTPYSNPHIRFRYWLAFADDSLGNPGQDLFTVRITNGSTGVIVMSISSAPVGMWHDTTFRVTDYLTPTNNIKLRFTVADVGVSNVVEAAIDAFEVFDMPLAVNEISAGTNVNIVYGDNNIFVRYKNLGGAYTCIVTDEIGRQVFQTNLQNHSGQIIMPEALTNGIYFVQIVSANGTGANLKFVK